MINKKNFKVIVIGSGPGGSIPAEMISKRGYDVLLIEKGEFRDLNSVKPFSGEELSKKYKNGGLTMSFGQTNINYVEGSCVGGGSEVNSGLYHRLPDEVLKKWEEKNKITIDKDHLKNAYNTNEEDLSISYLKSNTPKASLKIINGCSKLNWNCKEVPRWYKYDSNNNGVKQSMTETYIPRFLKNGGYLLENSTVIKISSSGKNRNVHVLSKGETTIYSSEYVFMSAGAIDSPFLLRKSGYKGLVGKGLKTHPSFKFTAYFDEEVYSNQDAVAVHQVKEFSPKITMGCSVSNKPYVGIALNDNERLSEISAWKNMANYYIMISPEGSGRVSSLPFLDSPFVYHKLTKYDYHKLNEGIFLLAKLLFESGAKRIYPSCTSFKEFSNLEDVYKLQLADKKDLKLMTIHLFCSNQMAGNKKLGPVNPEGCLWEDNSIYVSDGSILVDSPTVNPQGIIMALARLNADVFLNKLQNEF